MKTLIILAVVSTYKQYRNIGKPLHGLFVWLDTIAL